MSKEKTQSEEISEEKQALIDRRGWIENQGEKIAPAFKILILAIICFIAVGARVFSVIRYESIIHEFDPWFNFRGSEILEKQGWYSFKYWID